MADMMKAWRVYAFGDMRLDEVPRPQVRPGWIVVRVRVVQPSVTEVLYFRGVPVASFDKVKRKIDEEAPVQLFGHEFCGEVVEVGPGVDGVRVGDRVASGHGEGYSIGVDFPGCFAEYAAIPVESIVKVPPEIDDHEGAALQPLMTGVGAVARAGVGTGDTVAIMGQGVIGLCCLQVARVSGAGKIIVVDLRPESLELSRRFGADVLIDSSQVDPVKAVAEAAPEGVDLVFEAAAGRPQEGLAGFTTLEQAFRIVRRGGKVMTIAHYDRPAELDLNFLRRKAVNWLFPYTPPRKILEHAVRLVVRKQVQLRPMITHTVKGLAQLPEAMEITASKGKYKATNPAQIIVAAA